MTEDDASTAGWLAAIDRELLLAAFSHDVRGPLTALDGYVEYEGLETNSPGRLVLHRLGDLVRALSTRCPRASVDTLDAIGDLPPVPVAVSVPLLPLRIALMRLEHGPLELIEADDSVTVIVSGASTELDVEWSLADVRRWLNTPAPGLAAARVRMAARMVGATSSIESSRGMARALLHVRFERAGRGHQG